MVFGRVATHLPDDGPACEVVSKADPASPFIEHIAVRERLESGSAICRTGPQVLGVYDPDAAIVIDTANTDMLFVRPSSNAFRRRRADRVEVPWREIRAAVTDRNRQLATPSIQAALHRRMHDFLAARCDQTCDLSWVGGLSMTLPFLPIVVTGLAPAQLRRIEREQEERFRTLLSPVGRREPWLRTLRKHAAIQRNTLALTAEMRGRVAGTRPPRDDLAQALVPFADRLSSRRLAYLVTSLLVAGSGAPGAMAASILLALVDHPAMRDRIAAEFATLAAGELYQLPATKLAFTLRFIREAMRLWAFPLITHRVAGGDLSLDGHLVRAGETYELSSYALHHSPRYWSDPERFDPDRWLAPRPEARRGTYVPFGFAPRACLGAALGHLQLVLFCELMTREFTVAVAPGTTPVRRWDGFAIPGDFVGRIRWRA